MSERKKRWKPGSDFLSSAAAIWMVPLLAARLRDVAPSVLGDGAGAGFGGDEEAGDEGGGAWEERMGGGLAFQAGAL